MACSKSSKNMDFFGNVPDNVIDKILESLPIRRAAQTSVLSKQWRRAWLSLKILVFDSFFWRQQKNSDWRKCSQIISDILIYHNGPVYEFYLYIPSSASDDHMNHSRWISFLSNNGARKIVMVNWYVKMNCTSYIFQCSELVHLKLVGFRLNHPPTDFGGFPNLKYLELENTVFITQNFFGNLIETCRKLETLKLMKWSGLDHIVIDAPSLETLVLKGDFESVAFRNVRSLENISMHLSTKPKKLITVETVNAIKFLASSCHVQSIDFNGQLCKFLAAGGVIRSTLVTFNHLHELCLSDINLSDFGVYCYILSLIECCPYIKTLDIALIPGENISQNILDFNFTHKLDHLRKVSIKGITGSSAELKLLEYMLAISTSLENLFFKSGKCSVESKLKMSRALMSFPRASPKALLVCRDR